MNIIEQLVRLEQIAERYGAHRNVNVAGRSACYTLPVPKGSQQAQDLAQCFYLEATNCGAVGPWAIQTRDNEVWVTLGDWDAEQPDGFDAVDNLNH